MSKAEGRGPNPYYTGFFAGETEDLRELRLTLVSERDALKAELDRIRAMEPVAWRWSVKKLSGVEWRYTLHKTKPESEPLYTLEKP